MASVTGKFKMATFKSRVFFFFFLELACTRIVVNMLNSLGESAQELTNNFSKAVTYKSKMATGKSIVFCVYPER